jgi:hypothetical protein
VSNSLAAVDLFTMINPTKFEILNPNESQKTKDFMAIISDMQNRKSIKDGKMSRAFHAKSHGCLKGEFKVLENIPKHLQYGIFQQPGKSYDVLARFSNGVGFIQSDSKGDVKGFALKVSNVPGEKLLNLPGNDSHSNIQDFTMTNNPTPLADNVDDFVKLGMALDKGLLHGVAFLLQNLKVAAVVVKRVYGRKIETLVNESFWSGSPYLLGPNQAVKWNVTPCKTITPTQKFTNNENYLSLDLQDHLNNNDLCYNFNVQMQIDPIKQPIEKHLTEWTEQETPSINIAQVVFSSVNNKDNLSRDAECEATSFNPWNGIKDHQPLGNMNRARGQIYLNSFLNRDNFNNKK